MQTNTAPRYTIVVPFAPFQFATEWHPTEPTGPFATMVRGVFKTEAEAILWGKKHLNGTPYTVKVYEMNFEGDGDD